MLQILASAGVFSILLSGFIAVSNQSNSITRVYALRKQADSVNEVVKGNTASTQVCAALVANNLFGPKPFNHAAASADTGWSMVLSTGIKDSAGNDIVIADNTELESPRIKVEEFRFNCDDADNNGVCDCTMDPTTAACAQPQGPGSSLYSGQLKLRMAPVGPLVSGGFEPRTVDVAMVVDGGGNLVGCQPDKGPDVYCRELGGNWVTGPVGIIDQPFCSFLPLEKKCAANQVISADFDGNGSADCVNVDSECPAGEFVVGVQNGVVQCQAIPGAVWDVGAWGGCDLAFNPPRVSRRVVCKRSTGQTVNPAPPADEAAPDPIGDPVCAALGYPTPVRSFRCSDWQWVNIAWQCIDGYTQRMQQQCRNQLGQVSPQPAVDCPPPMPPEEHWSNEPWGACGVPTPLKEERIAATCDNLFGDNCSACPAPPIQRDCGVLPPDCTVLAGTNWVEGGNTCTSDADVVIPNSGSGFLTDNTGDPRGTVQYACDAAGNASPIAGTADCNPGAVDCVHAPGSLSWTDGTGAFTCTNTNAITLIDGAGATNVLDTTAPDTGGADYTCVAGVTSAPVGGTCGGGTCVIGAEQSFGEADQWDCYNYFQANSLPLCPAGINTGDSVSQAALSPALGCVTSGFIAAPPGCAVGVCGSCVFGMRSCNPLPPSTNCARAAGAITWQDPTLTYTCSNTNAVVVVDGAPATNIQDTTDPETGAANFTCAAGVLSAPAGATCAPSGLDGVWVKGGPANCPAGYVYAELRDDTDPNHRLEEDDHNGTTTYLCVRGMGAYWAAGCGGDVDSTIRDDGVAKHQLNEDNNMAGADLSWCLTGVSAAAWYASCPSGWTNVGGIQDDSDAKHNLNEGGARDGAWKDFCVQK